MAWHMPGPDAPPEQLIEALRVRALTALIYADVVDQRDKPGAAQAREIACQLRCQAAVIEAMSALYRELGLRAEQWGEIAARMREFSHPL